MASHPRRTVSSFLFLFFPGTFPCHCFPSSLPTLYSVQTRKSNFLSIDHNTEEIIHHCTFLPSLYTVPRLVPCSCITLFSYFLPLIHKGGQFSTGLPLRTPQSFYHEGPDLSDINCPVPFAFLLEVASTHLFLQRSWHICYQHTINK